MTELTIEELLRAGVHYGHQTHRWNPKMKKYILTVRDGLHIIDPLKTLECYNLAKEVVRRVARDKGIILFVGTKKQAQSIVKEEATRCGMFYVVERWLGGMLTNFQTIRQSVQKLKDIERMKTDGTYEKLTKKEVMRLEKKREKLEKVLSGVRNMERLPDLLVVVDVKLEYIPVAEAKRLGIPVIGICDTNADPELVDYPIPANDDSMRSIRLFIGGLSQAILEERGEIIPVQEAKTHEPTEETPEPQIIEEAGGSAELKEE